MSTIDTMCAAEASETRAAAVEVGATQPKSYPVRRLWASFLLWMQKREGRLVLRELTGDQLRDIGLSPSEAKAEVSKSFFWD
ncbi:MULTISPECIES: DUF1127 domain-containing protein [Rhizobium]|uniref:Uncharacterized conserved protein YjiS, DUF1127 family n=1 Tax=Rhizobium miluonense TaxID=411945 RepID=A0A1C3WR24_9HYPH|nr:DUF1127 domain-containing protein [Rhizobium miluonense]SCB42184.1 Uncharacterized conserved protein YjiS, DUF1127 family [Rhizobium miluonense]